MGNLWVKLNCLIIWINWNTHVKYKTLQTSGVVSSSFIVHVKHHNITVPLSLVLITLIHVYWGSVQLTSKCHISMSRLGISSVRLCTFGGGFFDKKTEQTCETAVIDNCTILPSSFIAQFQAYIIKQIGEQLSNMLHNFIKKYIFCFIRSFIILLYTHKDRYK